MARYTCQRCKAVCNTTDDPHLCADLKKRYERQAKAVSLVKEILRKHVYDDEYGTYRDEYYDEVAIEIVKALSGRDLGD